MVKTMTIIVLVFTTLAVNLATASSKLDLNQFVGTFESTNSSCPAEIKISKVCDGLRVSKFGNGYEITRTDLCQVDKGWDRELQRSSGGHGMVPSLDYSKTKVVSIPEQNKLVLVERTKSFSIVVFNSEYEMGLSMNNENSLVVETSVTTDVSPEKDPVVCHYRRK